MTVHIKEKDFDNIMKMIDTYHEIVIRVKNMADGCVKCEHWDLFQCKLKNYYFRECVKIGEGMRSIFKDIDYECGCYHCGSRRGLVELWEGKTICHKCMYGDDN
jgi:hypothetical protein